MGHYNVTLHNRKHNIDVTVYNLTVTLDIRAYKDFVFDSPQVYIGVDKIIAPESADMLFGSSVGDWVVKTIYERAANDFYLDASAENVLAIKSVNGLGTNIVLTTNPISATKALSFSGSGLFELFNAEAVQTGRRSYFSGKNDFALLSGDIAPFVQKSISADYQMEILSSVNELVELFIPNFENGLEMNGWANGVLVAYRLLSDMVSDTDGDGIDNINLGTFDAMSLESVDFIES